MRRVSHRYKVYEWSEVEWVRCEKRAAIKRTRTWMGDEIAARRLVPEREARRHISKLEGLKDGLAVRG